MKKNDHIISIKYNEKIIQFRLIKYKIKNKTYFWEQQFMIRILII